MVIVGSLLALLCGAANSAAAALEKRETVRATSAGNGGPLLLALVRRGWWLLAMALSVLGWSAEAGALGLAPVPVVTTLRCAGRGGLVVAGHRWLGERFTRLELAGVGLVTAGGILTASSVSSSSVASKPLSNLTELFLAVVVAAVAVLMSRSSSGLMIGAAVGVVFVATGVFTKEVGDRIVRVGLDGVPGLLATPGPWAMIVLSIWAIGLLQRAFLRANAASVSAASTAVSADGLIIASVLLYKQPLAPGAAMIPLIAGIVVSTGGALAMAFGGRRAAPVPPPPPPAGRVERAGA